MIPVNEIICGDCADVLSRFPPSSVDLVLTSPPYDDLRTYDGAVFDFRRVADELRRVVKPGGVVVWIVGDATKKGTETGTSFRQALGFCDRGFRLHDTMIYKKKNPIPLTHRRYEQSFEFMFVFSLGSPATFNALRDPVLKSGRGGTFRQRDDSLRPRNTSRVNATKIRGNVWEYTVGSKATTVDKINHPAAFPEALARDHIISWSNAGDLVVDIFNGSGTTTKIAKSLGRRFVGIDVVERYCQEAMERLSNV